MNPDSEKTMGEWSAEFSVLGYPWDFAPIMRRFENSVLIRVEGAIQDFCNDIDDPITWDEMMEILVPIIRAMMHKEPDNE